MLETATNATQPPVIEVTDGMLRVGRARIERSFVGAVTAHLGADAFAMMDAKNLRRLPFFAKVGAPDASGTVPSTQEVIGRIMKFSPEYGLEILGPSPL